MFESIIEPKSDKLLVVGQKTTFPIAAAEVIWAPNCAFSVMTKRESSLSFSLVLY